MIAVFLMLFLFVVLELVFGLVGTVFILSTLFDMVKREIWPGVPP